MARVDEDLLERTTRPMLAQIDAKPHNASLVLRDGRPVVIPARPGVTVRPAEIGDAVRQWPTTHPIGASPSAPRWLRPT